MNDELTYAPWVNTPGFVYQAEKREEENLTQQLPLATLIEAGEPTQVMRRRDFQAVRAPARPLALKRGKPKRSSSLIPVLGALSVSLLLFAFVYFGATWLAYIVEF
jgi:hypothetical protein